MSLLREKDLEYYSRHGIRRYWIVVSPDEAFFEIKRNIELLRGRKPRTADFTTMYTCLIHDRIIKNTRIAVSEALEYDQKRCSGDSRRIPTNLPELQVIMDHVQHIVKNTYLLTKNGTIRRQKIGLPMGTNSAPELANLTLYVDESQYIDGLVQSPNAQDLELAKDHAFTQRLIDDLKTWDIEPPPKEIYGLEGTETTRSDGSVIFLVGNS